MEKWEYQTRFFEARADKKEVRRYIKSEFDKRAKRYSPESMIPELNELGEEGWEIIHMEPVARVGGKENVLFDNDYRWSNTYFCVLKRRKPGSFMPIMPASMNSNKSEPVQQAAPQKTQEASTPPAQASTPGIGELAQKKPAQNVPAASTVPIPPDV